MIFLIAGPPRSGKTTLAKKISGRFRCPALSADWLRSVVLPYLASDSEGKGVLENILFKKGKQGGQKTDIEEAQVLWPGLRSFILDKARWSGDFILEGIQLTPEHLREVIGQDHLGRICAIVLVKTDPEKILSGFKQVKHIKHDWLLKRHINDEEHLRSVAEHIAKQGAYFQAKATEYGIEVVNMDDDFMDNIDAAAAWIADVRKRARVADRRRAHTGDQFQSTEETK